MKTVAVLFSYLAICLPLTYAQTFCLNGLIPCAANAQCNGGPSGDCVCLPGFKGDGRVFCGSTTTQCVCAARGDPVITVTDGLIPDTLTENLPCKVNLFLSVTDPSGLCTINYVNIVPEVRTNPATTGPVFRTFVDALEISVFDGNIGAGFSGTLNELGFNPPSSQVATSTSGGFSIATLTSCSNTALGFNATYGGMYVNIPKPVTFTPSLLPRAVCGNCDGVSDNPGTTPDTQLLTTLKALTAPGRQTTAPFATQCASLATTVSTCTPANLAVAAKVCQPYLAEFGQCLRTQSMAPATILTNFVSCVSTACTNGGPAACTLRTSHGPSCPVTGPCP